MCLTTTEDITVYKVVHQHEHNKVNSLVANFEYTFGVLYETEFTYAPERNIGTECELHPTLFRKREVHKGFHAFLRQHVAETLFTSKDNTKIVECLIPAGTQYYKGTK